MKVQQISVFMENRAGRLNAVAGLLGQEGINIRALSLADTSDFGILRLIVDRPEKAEKALREANYTVSTTDVVAIEIPDSPGGLAAALDALSRDGFNVEYMYAFLEKATDKAIVVFRFEDVDAVIAKLKDSDALRILSRDEVLAL